MDIEQIKELIKILEDSKLNKLTLKDKDGSEIHLEKMSGSQPIFSQPYMPAAHHPMAISHETSSYDKKGSSEPSESQSGGDFVTAPLVGTFYASASPGEPAFVKVGDEIKEDTVVCIIEAMKVMNEVKAGKSGRVVEICVDNSSPVEFGTKLFKIV